MGEREATRRREREQHTHSSRVNRGSGNPRKRRDTHTHPGTIRKEEADPEEVEAERGGGGEAMSRREVRRRSWRRKAEDSE